MQSIGMMSSLAQPKPQSHVEQVQTNCRTFPHTVNPHSDFLLLQRMSGMTGRTATDTGRISLFRSGAKFLLKPGDLSGAPLSRDALSSMCLPVLLGRFQLDELAGVV
jgi:hypothetical protein